MKRAALIGLLTWAAFAAAYGALLRGRIPYALPAAIGAGLFMATVTGTYRIALASVRDARRLSGTAPPADGATVAITGPIRTSAPLRAPFTGRAAALYVYDVEHDTESAEGDPRAVKDYSGLALAPSAVDSAYGPIRILGFPTLEGFERIADRSAAMREAAAGYIAATAFEDFTGFNVRETVEAVRQMVGDAVESVRKDWRLTDAGLTKKSRIVETVVEPGAAVSLVGRYSAAESAVVVAEGLPPRLVAGAPDEAAATLWQAAKQNAIVATAIAIGVNFMVALPFLLPRGTAPRAAATASPQPAPSFDAMYAYHEAIRRGDLAAAQKMVANGIPVNVRDLEEKTPLALAGNEATARWLLANGADANAEDEHGQTVLMEQTTSGHAGIVKLLIAHGARLDEADPRYHMTALQLAEYTEHLDVAQILREAGAHDDTVTERNGTALHDDDAPVRVALTYLDALFANEIVAVNGQWIAERQHFGETDLKTYRSVRPHPAHLLRGFANDRRATLELRGHDPDGGAVTWRYDLLLVNGQWKLRDEAWETRFNGVE